MNLDEMKAALASEATKKAEEQEREIKLLQLDLKRANEQIKEYQDMLRIMFNRCIALTKGAMCFFCGHRDSCDNIRNTGRRDNG